MIFVEHLLRIFKKKKVFFYTGVPDSILKNFSTYLDKLSKSKHVLATNEGSAVSIGIGYYLSTKKIPCIYMQNSGLGNAINPLSSIAHKKVYSIPLLLLIGWRGSPKKNDEPQHKTKGKITPKLLKLLDINYCILRNKSDLSKLSRLLEKSYNEKKPVACLVEQGTLKTKKTIKKIKNNKLSILRKDFIYRLLKNMPNNSKIISTTGYTSRELLHVRNEKKIFKGKDFYMVGGMGHTAMVGLGHSLNSKKKVICLDGDGSILMHLGSLRTFGYFGKSNLKHILLNNNSHESVGGQITNAININFKNLVKSLGYRNYFKIRKKNEIDLVLNQFIKSKGPSFLEVLISVGSINNLLRPKNLIKIKNKFIK